jgi:hypothetical protein
MQRGRYIQGALLAGILALSGWFIPSASAEVPGWSDKTVGDTEQGSASVDGSGVWTISGSGNDVWAREDEFHIVYKPLAGDGSVTTKLLSAEEGSEWSKFGVMMREDLDAEAAKMLTLQMDGPPHGVASILRSITGEHTGKDRKFMPENNSDLYPREFPVWLKIERRGDRFTPYVSEDGALWVPVTRSQQIPMKNDIFAGVYVSSHEDGSLISGTFDGAASDVSSKLLKPEEAVPLQPNPVIAMGGDNAVILTWERVNHLGKDADGYVVYKAAVGDDTFTKIAEVPGDKSSYADTTIKNGEVAQYRVTTVVNVGDKTLETRPFTNLLYSVVATPNPPIKIGDRDYFGSLLDGGADREVTETPGGASIDGNGVVTLRASGWDIQNDYDGGYQLVTPVSGDFTFTARVLGPPEVVDDEANEWAKFGIGVRESTLAESRYAAMLVTPLHGIRSPHRRMFTAGEQSEDLGPNEDEITYPITMRIQRRGDVITMFTSPDGTTFTEYGEPAATTLEGLVPNVYVGLIGTAHDNAQVAQTRFDNIQLTTP